MTVVEKVKLNFADLKNNNNKYYDMEVISDAGSYVVNKRWGRVGANGQSKSLNFANIDLAMREFNKTVNNKTRKGYIPVQIANVSDDSVKVQNMDSLKYDANVLKLIASLYKDSEMYVKKTVETPLGKLSECQIKKGEAILDSLESKLGSCSNDTFIDLSNEFYKVIPVVFGSRRGRNMDDLILNTLEKIEAKRDLLDAIRSLVATKDFTSIEQKYESLGINLKYVDKGEDEFKRIVKWVDNTAVHKRLNYKITNMYKVEDMNGAKDFNPYKVKTMELFHGTRTENVVSIFKTGLKHTPPKSVYTNGKMFGHGIYSASNSTKALNYCNSFGSANSNKYYFFVLDVAVGKIKDFSYKQPSLTKAPYGYNSVRGKAGRSLKFDEYIVYNDNQVKLKYVVEFEFN